ncbi:hypothetical protein PROFUN_03471 [Planoprotostelium fungivorum]|uniref:Uncharacterized protein n=1 Tax=Planoprotostelium fungivorum TaxID=1890364 RepID=A0A2P6MN83_9EUKA|nr:hypothetical protein PROFUN_03471 [Planoprotostelium fungivorum]
MSPSSCILRGWMALFTNFEILPQCLRATSNLSQDSFSDLFQFNIAPRSARVPDLPATISYHLKDGSARLTYLSSRGVRQDSKVCFVRAPSGV